MSADWAYIPASDAPDAPCYYANLATGETQWERPVTLDSEASSSSSSSSPGKRASVKVQKAAKAVAAAAKWVEYMDETHGRPYFYNETTGETAWFIPADDDEDDDEGEEEAGGAEDEAAAKAAAEAEAEKAKAKAAKRAARRIKILEEIVSTEQSYVDALRCLTKVYVDPLRMVADVPKGAIFSHADLDSIFLNITVITKVNETFLAELAAEQTSSSSPNYAPILKKAANKFKGCYTRYVNNFDEAAERLVKIAASDKPADKDKHRYLVGSAKHPDAKGRDLRSFLIQPVQRVPRYRMLLEDLFNHTDEGHPEREDIQQALDAVVQLAKSFNADKAVVDDHAQLLTYFEKFCDKDATTLKAELNSYERKFIKEGSLIKARLSHRQKRQLFLLSDVLLYAEGSLKGFKLKGKIPLLDGTRCESLPRTDEMPYAFALVERGGKGYTWLADSLEEKDEWFKAIDGAIRAGRKKAGLDLGEDEGDNLLAMVKTKRLPERIFVMQGGSTLIKYNKADGKATPRWVCVTLDKMGKAELIRWGDPKTKECKKTSEKKLAECTALMHGAKSSAFFKQKGSKTDQDWQCFSLVFKDRTLDFAATNAEMLMDWYLALASFLPQSTDQLLNEEQLRARIASQMKVG